MGVAEGGCADVGAALGAVATGTDSGLAASPATEGPLFVAAAPGGCLSSNLFVTAIIS